MFRIRGGGMAEQRRLPAPATQMDEYLFAIVLELRAMNETLTALATMTMNAQAVEIGDMVALREVDAPAPATTRKKRKASQGE